jgi:hypothetical protein
MLVGLGRWLRITDGWRSATALAAPARKILEFRCSA